jgi:hypothetical protein
MNMALNVVVPRDLTDGKSVFFTTTQLFRRSLPNTILAETVFPLLVLPERTTANLLLPLRYWSPGLISRWNKVFSQNWSSVPPESGKIIPQGTFDPVAVEAYLESPVQLTSEAAQMANSSIREVGTLETTSLWVNIQPGNLYDITMMDRPFKEIPFPVETVSDGIGIVISAYQATQLRGLRIGFKRSSLGNGFTFE